MKHRRRVISGVLTSLVAGAVGGCAESDTFDRNAPEVQAGRQKAADQVGNSVRAAVGGLPGYGSAEQDGCEPGEDNVTSQDEYRWRCTVGYWSIAGVSGKNAAEAVAFVEKHLKQVGCSGNLGDDRRGLAALDVNNDLALGPESTYICAGGQVYIQVIRSNDPAAPDQVTGRPRGPGIPQSPVDGPAALLKAAGDGYKYVLVADFSEDYYVLPRTDSE
jgi:hypothetical protein